MACPTTPTLCVVANTRQVSVELAPGVSASQFIALLNLRQVRLVGDVLTNGGTGQALVRRIIAVNQADYRLADDQCPLPSFDAIDPFQFDYNQI